MASLQFSVKVRYFLGSNMKKKKEFDSNLSSKENYGSVQIQERKMQDASGLSEVRASILEKIMASQLRERRTLNRRQVKRMEHLRKT